MKIIDYTPFFAGRVTSSPDQPNITMEECLTRAQKTAAAGDHLYSRSDFNLDDWITYNSFLADILRRTGGQVEFIRASNEDLANISPTILFEQYGI